MLGSFLEVFELESFDCSFDGGAGVWEGGIAGDVELGVVGLLDPIWIGVDHPVIVAPYIVGQSGKGCFGVVGGEGLANAELGPVPQEPSRAPWQRQLLQEVVALQVAGSREVGCDWCRRHIIHHISPEGLARVEDEPMPGPEEIPEVRDPLVSPIGKLGRPAGAPT